MIKISIIIPCYNESKSLPTLLRNFSQKLQEKDVEMMLVDNGSTDNTKKTIFKLKKKYKFLKSIYIKKNIGYGNGIIKGIQKANGNFISWTHADLQTDPYDVIKGIKKFEKQLSPKIFIKGKRYGRSFQDLFYTVGMSLFETFLLRKFLWDINAQPNIFHKSFLKKIKNPPLDASLDLFFYYSAIQNNLRIYRFPVNFAKRQFGKSSWNFNFKNKINFIKRTIEYSLKLKKNYK